MQPGGGIGVDSARNRFEEVFSDALEQAPELRASFLDRACGEDTALRAEVEALLSADSSASGFMESPACDSSWVGLPSGETARQEIPPGTRIGSYSVIRYIATGGMGSVYEAIQDQPRRTVALKVLRAGLTTPKDIRRFQFESDLLGRLQHPGIARIYEAGMHDDGTRSVPYFAMEYLPEACSIVEHARRRGLSIAERMELMAQVCDAVHHGHQKGVIHRDLKPGNLLVSCEPDHAPAVKVIDFGVAVAMDADRQATLRAEYRELAGTLEYMSPEQVGGDDGEMDTRSDVYSLGVILYELLSDARPFDLSGMALAEALRTILESRPPALEEIRPELRGDPATIVAKAMAPEKANRYQSAAELAADLRRYPRNEPIAARPFSRVYYVRKFIARNRALVLGVVLAALGLVAGSSVAVWKAIEATRQRNRAQAEAQRAEQINAFLRSILNAADPRTSTVDVSVRAALDRAVAQFDRAEVSDPATYARIESMIGGIYARMERNAEAARHLALAVDAYREASGGAADLTLANALADLAWVTFGDDEQPYRAGYELFSEALEITRRILGEEDAAVANLKVYVATSLRDMGEFERADVLFDEGMRALRAEKGEECGDYAFALTMLAGCRYRQNRHAEAEDLYRRGLAIQRRVLGEDHVQVAITLNCLARLLGRQGRSEEARLLQEQADAIRARRIGPREICE